MFYDAIYVTCYCFILRSFVNDVQAKLNALQQQVKGGGNADSAYDSQRHQQQVMDTISGLQNNVKTLISQQVKCLITQQLKYLISQQVKCLITQQLNVS